MLKNCVTIDNSFYEAEGGFQMTKRQIGNRIRQAAKPPADKISYSRQSVIFEGVLDSGHDLPYATFTLPLMELKAFRILGLERHRWHAET